jgi:hypothetical protein
LQALLKLKERKKQQTTEEDIEDTQRLVTEEIEMLKVVFCIWSAALLHGGYS